MRQAVIRSLILNPGQKSTNYCFANKGNRSIEPFPYVAHYNMDDIGSESGSTKPSFGTNSCFSNLAAGDMLGEAKFFLPAFGIRALNSKLAKSLSLDRFRNMLSGAFPFLVACRLADFDHRQFILLQ
jgi:hypothetical protein